MNRARIWFEFVFAPLLILLAGFAVYAGSFQGEFILDDLEAIQNNRSIRHLWPLTDVLIPGHKFVTEGSTVEGRPLLNLSFALNYAAGGLNVAGYHVVNLAIHLLNGLLVFGVMRRSLLRPAFRDCTCGAQTWLAFFVALIWLIHPLQTESVVYVAQRAETLVSLFYLSTLYCFIRQSDAQHPRLWQAAAVLACVLGMGVKEVMVTAPLLVLLYDWFFVAGSWREAWRTRWRFHLCLMLLGWGTLAAVMIGTNGSNLGNVKALLLQVGGTEDSVWAGHEIHSRDYAKAQIWAVAHYVKLSIWPSPLVFTYGMDIPPSIWGLITSALLVVLMLAGTGFACRKRHWLGYAGAWFFLILAPTSSVVPLSGQLVAEHRMYLPLAGMVVPMVIAAWLAWRWFAKHLVEKSKSILSGGMAAAAAVLGMLLVLGDLTMARIADYKTALSIWQDTVSKWPTNASAHVHVGNSLLDQGEREKAIASYRRAMELNPDSPDVHTNLGNALIQVGQEDEAMIHHQRAMELRPQRASTHINLGNVLLQKGRYADAIEQYRIALDLKPESSEAQIDLGNALLQTGHTDEAVQSYQKSLELNPGDSAALNNLGNALLRKGQRDQAIDFFKKALAFSPNLIDAQYNLGSARLHEGRIDDAIVHLERAIQIDPNFAEAHNELGSALVKKGMMREGMAHYEKAFALQPEDPATLSNLSWLLSTCAEASLRDGPRALELAERAARRSPNNQDYLLHILAAALADNGRLAEADETAERALFLATSRGNEALSGFIRLARACYQAGKPVRGRVPAPEVEPSVAP